MRLSPSFHARLVLSIVCKNRFYFIWGFAMLFACKLDQTRSLVSIILFKLYIVSFCRFELNLNGNRDTNWFQKVLSFKKIEMLSKVIRMIIRSIPTFSSQIRNKPLPKTFSFLFNSFYTSWTQFFIS